MFSGLTVLTVLLMALVTYLTRLGGFFALRNRTLGPRAEAVMRAAPGCVLISLIAPHFATANTADLAALAITAGAATRLPMLPTVFIGMGAAALLRNLM
jgi:uncharacterized membrane protein